MNPIYVKPVYVKTITYLMVSIVSILIGHYIGKTYGDVLKNVTTQDVVNSIFYFGSKIHYCVQGQINTNPYIQNSMAVLYSVPLVFFMTYNKVRFMTYFMISGAESYFYQGHRFFIYFLAITFFFLICAYIMNLIFDKNQNENQDETELETQADLLEKRMKYLESFTNIKIDEKKWFIVRIDGNRFSKFTRGFKKPLDENIRDSMIHTASDLLKKFGAYTAYTASDEISLVFPPALDDQDMMYGGRVVKIASLMAGYASARFNLHLHNYMKLNNVTDRQLKEKVGSAVFDARIFSVDSEEEAYDAIKWRAKYDTFNNGVSALASKYFSVSEMKGMNLGEAVMKLKIMFDIDVHEYDHHLFFGTYLKKKLVEMDSYNPKLKERVVAVRGKVFRIYMRSSDFTNQTGKRFVCEKYLDPSIIVRSATPIC